jgi:SAM-dependent methyltransferase
MTTMTDVNADPFARFKAAQREAWSVFAPVEVFTAAPAAKLVKFAQIVAGLTVLDVACGTGVVAVTAARLGAKTHGLDLSPALIERARQNAAITGLEVAFIEGDAEALPYPDASFDTVLSQFGHIFAPRPEAALGEMLRVLKPGGRIAFSAWPPELFTGRQFELIARYMPPLPPDAKPPAPPTLWGDPNVIRDRLGDRATSLIFERGTMMVPTLSVQHSRIVQEATIGPLAKIVGSLEGDPAKLARLRGEYEAMLGEVFEDNALHLHFIMARAVKVR